MADVIIFGLKDLHTIYRRAHETVGAGSSNIGVETFLSDLASHRRMLATPATIIESVIEDWASRFCRYVLGFVSDAQREVEALVGPQGTPPRNAPQVRSTAFFRSDPHDEAFGAVALELRTGDVWYYKPRPDLADRAVADLIEGLACRLGRPIPIRTPRTLAFGDHHWSHHVAPAAIDSAPRLAQAAEDLGAFAAIAYFFNLNDLHFENVVLSCPVAVIDAETSFANTPPGDGPLGNPALGHADRIAYELVRTGLVPTWQRAGFDSEWDLSPLGSHGEFKLDGFEPGGRGGEWVASIFGNKVTDLALSPEEYGLIVRPAFAEGFRTMFLQVLDARKGVGKLLDDIHQPWSRCILRQTHRYARILEKSFHPRVLFGLQDREDLIRQCLGEGEGRRAVPPAVVRDYEVSSLRRLSIPNFRADCRTTALTFDRKTCAGFFAETAIAEIGRRLDRSTEDDLDVLERCIDMQFKKRFSPHELSPP